MTISKYSRPPTSSARSPEVRRAFSNVSPARSSLLRLILLVGLGVAGPAAFTHAAFAFHPTGSCDGASAAGQVARASFVVATAHLERLEGGDFVELSTSEQQRQVAAGNFLISTPWSWSPASGATYRVRLETVVYDGLEETAPSANTLASWPGSQIHRLSATGSIFTCDTGRPEITSSPITIAMLAGPYAYAPSVSLPPSATPRFSLLASPPAMSVDVFLGDIAWSPSAADVGHHTVILLLEDEPTQSFDVQSFELVVSP